MLTIKKLLNVKINTITLMSLFMMIGCDSSNNAQEATSTVTKNVKFYTVKEQVTSFKRLYPSVIYGSKRVKLAFQVDGEINALNVKRGDFIKKGFLIATLESKKRKNNVDAAFAQLKQREKDYHRQKALTDKKVVSKAYLEQSKRNFEISEAHYKTAKKSYDDTFLKSPFDGIVSELYVENFQNVNAKEPILFLQDVDTLEARIDMPESDIARAESHLTNEQIIERYKPMISFAVYKDKSFPLGVKEFEAQGDPSTQTFRITFLFKKPEKYNIYPGMTAWVTLEGFSLDKNKLKGYYPVPVEAVFEKKMGQKEVWIVNKDMSVTAKKVEVSMLSKDKIFVKGLKVGDVIVASGANYIHKNDKVKELTHVGNRKLK